MKKAEIIYRLMNDMLRYLLKYGALKDFTESDIEQALAESEQICEVYRNTPGEIGYLAHRMCVAANSYFMQREKRREKP